MVTWSECAADFAGDGSLRDIYVLEGGGASWDAVLRIARQFDAKFFIEGEARPLPDRSREVFAQYDAGAALLSIDWKGIDLAAHFFDENQVELDFIPNVLTGQPDLDQLCSFLRTLAAATGREVIVTPENLPQSPILRVTPTGEVRYEPPSDAA
jgi:hypothetical protein